MKVAGESIRHNTCDRSARWSGRVLAGATAPFYGVAGLADPVGALLGYWSPGATPPKAPGLQRAGIARCPLTLLPQKAAKAKSRFRLCSESPPPGMLGEWWTKAKKSRSRLCGRPAQSRWR